MVGDDILLALPFALMAPALAVATWSEVAARLMRDPPKLFRPGSTSRTYNDVFALLMAGQAALVMSVSGAQGADIGRAWTLAAAAAIWAGLIFAAALADKQARKRRISRGATAILRDDVEARTAISKETWVSLTLHPDGEISIDAAMSPAARQALKALVRAEVGTLGVETGFPLHPLPRSATLRAAMVAADKDPMDTA